MHISRLVGPWTTPEIHANPKSLSGCSGDWGRCIFLNRENTVNSVIFVSYLFEFRPLQIYIAPNTSF